MTPGAYASMMLVVVLCVGCGVVLCGDGVYGVMWCDAGLLGSVIQCRVVWRCIVWRSEVWRCITPR